MKPYIITLLFLFLGMKNLSYGINYNPHLIQRKIYRFYTQWDKTKYKYGGTTKSGVDCSGLMDALYKKEFHKRIPRTTLGIAKFGRRTNLKHLRIGDLILFKMHHGHHVGVYVGHNKFMQSCNSKGVTISRFSPYWHRHYWQSRRILLK